MGAPAPPQRRAAAEYGYLGEMMGYRLGGAVLLCALAGVAWGAAPGKSYDVFIIPGSGMATLLAQTTAQLGQYHLEPLTKPFNKAQADNSTSQRQQCKMGIQPPFEANTQLAKTR
ncbi:hypothetical protein FGU63_15600 [Edwardsiella ictaluri]|nr:hypothetical protein FGU63_15600 [Edwardsiella ictaluri]